MRECPAGWRKLVRRVFHLTLAGISRAEVLGMPATTGFSVLRHRQRRQPLPGIRLNRMGCVSASPHGATREAVRRKGATATILMYRQSPPSREDQLAAGIIPPHQQVRCPAASHLSRLRFGLPQSQNRPHFRLTASRNQASQTTARSSRPAGWRADGFYVGAILNFRSGVSLRATAGRHGTRRLGVGA